MADLGAVTIMQTGNSVSLDPFAFGSNGLDLGTVTLINTNGGGSTVVIPTTGITWPRTR